MEVETCSDHIARKFGHCVINWKIENYCLATCKENWIIDSSEFFVKGPQLSKWKMSLNPKSKVNKTFCITMFLKRLDFEGSNVVWANWKLSFVNSKDDAFYTTECEFCFKKKASYGIDLQGTNVILDKLHPFDSDTLRIRCQLIVYHENLVNKFEKPNSIGLKSLSHDMKLLYKRGKLHDIVLRIGNQDIRAHKAILKARNRQMANIIDQNNKKVIELPILVDYEAMEKVVAYLYTGNLQFVLKPSISLFECVTFLDINELKSYYAPDELIASTYFNSQEFVYLWLIKDFGNRSDCVTSPILNEGLSEISWKLRLYPQGVEDDVHYIAIFAEVVQLTKPQDVCVEFAILDTSREFFWLRRLQRCLEGNDIFGVKDFVKRDCLDNSTLLSDDTLRVAFKIRTTNGQQFASLGSRMTYFVTSDEKDKSYDSLSIDLRKIFETSDFSDIVLSVEGKTFNAHKCILAARSSTFSEMISNMSENQTTLTILNVKADIFRIMISYIYSGILKEFKTEDLPHLYEAAESYEVSHLKDICSSYLQSNLEIEIASEILVFAEGRQDKDLKLAVMKFICLNDQAVYDHLSWRTLTVTNPSLCSEVQEFVKINHVKLKSLPVTTNVL